MVILMNDLMFIIDIIWKLIQLVIAILTLIGTLFTVYQGIIHFWPEKEYIIRYKLTKPIKKWINRNLPIDISFFKSCIITEKVDKELIFNEIKSLFSSKQNILVEFDKEYIKIHFNEVNFSFDYIITFEEYNAFNESEEYILIKQNSTVAFKDMSSFLNNSFWILRDLMDLDYFKDNTKKIEIVLSSKKFTFFDNTLRIFGDINGNNWSISKNNDISLISMNVFYNLDSIEKVIEIILLNLSNN